VPSDTTAKKLQKLFRACGKIEKIWFRSICVVEDSKKPQRAKIITKELGNFKDSKNAYILYKEEKSCQEAKIKFNQVLFEQRHLRVDTMRITAAEQEQEGKFVKEYKKDERHRMVNSWEDYESTIFIGNLPFIVSEEELRQAFVDCGTI